MEIIPRNTRGETLSSLIGTTIVKASRVGIDATTLDDTEPKKAVLSDTLILSLADGRRYELLCEQARILFLEIIPGRDVLRSQDFDLYFRVPATMLRTSAWLSELLSRKGLREVRSRDGSRIFYVFESLELSDEEEESVQEIGTDNGVGSLPRTVSSITEVWAGEGGRVHLFAATLWDEQRQPIFSLYFTNDEIAILSIADQRRILEDLPFYFGSVLYYWYDTNKPRERESRGD